MYFLISETPANLADSGVEPANSVGAVRTPNFFAISGS